MPSRRPNSAWRQNGRSLPFSRTTRRRFLQGSAAAMTGLVLSNCANNLADVSSSEADAESGGEATSDGKLHIYTWSSYINEAVAKRFTDETGIEVVFDIYDSNETMLAKLQAGGGAAYSIIYPSDYMVQEMIELGLLGELDKSKIQGLDDLFENWQNPVYDANNQYSIPYAWGTTGFIYNSEELDPDPEDWNYLWDEQEQLSRRMTLVNDVREVMGGVLKSLGYSYNTTDPAEIEEAYQKLVELKPAISSFTTDGWRDPIVSGDLVLAMVYSVDAAEYTAADPALKYVIPGDGSSIWTDTMVIPSGAPNSDAAYQWMNFMLDPENGAWVVEELKFATPSKVAYDKISDELKQDPTLFPSEEILAKCEGIAPVGDAADIYDKYWTQLTSA